MRRFFQDWDRTHLRMMLNNARRRHDWFTRDASPRQLVNAMFALGHFALKTELVRAWPIIVKIDISPLCNLRCTYCVHARPSANSSTLLGMQAFDARQKMSVRQFEQIIDEIGGKSMAVSLYYLGDPLVHPNLAEMCAIASQGRLNSHISTNFSFGLPEDKLVDLVESGLTHLTVCVDGLTQEKYERTRVGGKLDIVLANLERTLEIRRELGRNLPRVEVQYIKYQHNVSELDEAAAWCDERGVDQFTSYWGHLHNYTDVSPDNYQVLAPKNNRQLPQCTWPYFSMQIKYDGDVIPCCYYRHGEQYAGEESDSRVVGNVFESSIWEVWNSPEYRALRRLVARPELAREEPELNQTFCDGCPTIFETDVGSHVLRAQNVLWEDFYLRDDRGIVRRRAD
jgi:MoaA/NifB/PqqE/SkfB family radical SAM enzyme